MSTKLKWTSPGFEKLHMKKEYYFDHRQLTDEIELHRQPPSCIRMCQHTFGGGRTLHLCWCPNH